MGVALYDDRLEVTSSGSLHFGLTPEMLLVAHESRPWNPMIARTFYRRGTIEEWGSGTLKMAGLASAAGLPVPEIEDANDCVTVCFRHDQCTCRNCEARPHRPNGNRRFLPCWLGPTTVWPCVRSVLS